MFNIAFRFFNMITISKFTIISKSINFFKVILYIIFFNMIKIKCTKTRCICYKTIFLSNSSTCLVVCLPRLSDLEISLVSRFSSGLNVFINVDFPTPDCPLSTIRPLGQVFTISTLSVFTYKLNRISYFLICI